MKRTNLLCAVLLLAACSKNKSNTATSPSPAAVKTPKELIAGTWAIQSVTTNDPSNPDPLAACAEDDQFTFKADGICTADQGSTLCDPSSPQTQNGTWKLDAYPALEVKNASDTLQSTTKIIQLDETTLKWERVYTNVSPAIFTYTWKRK